MAARGLFGAAHQGAGDAAAAGGGVHQQLRHVGAVRLVLRRVEHQLHGAHQHAIHPGRPPLERVLKIGRPRRSAGARQIGRDAAMPSGQAALISTLETPLMPFWIWVGFSEVPTLRVLAGGALVMGAVIADIIGDIRTQRPSV